MVVFVMKVQDGQISDIHSSVLTLLFSIGKNLAQNKVRSDQNRGYRQQQYYHRVDKYDEINEVNEIDEGSVLVLREIDCMKNPCKSILEQYYFKNSSLKEIAVSLNYKSAKSVKVQKYRCLKTLKDKIFSNKVK
jgi:DNA-directed RNA polymerase specialized sigma24 family protein